MGNESIKINDNYDIPLNKIILTMRRKQIKNENFFVYSKNLLKINLIYLYFIHIFIYINVYF